MLRKHFTLWYTGIIKSLAHRSEIFLWLILDAIPTLVLCVAWASIFKDQPVLRGLSFSDILNYYLFVNLIKNISASHFEQWRVQQIREGKIDYYMTRPLSYLLEIWWSHLGGKTFYISCSLVFFMLLRWWMTSAWNVQPVNLHPVMLLQFSICVAAAFLIEFFVGLFIVIVGFWFDRSDGLEHFKWIIITLFSGAMLPLAMMPNWLRAAVEALPLKYMFAWPVGIIQGTHSLNFNDVVYLASFLALLCALNLVTWRAAIKNYASAN